MYEHNALGYWSGLTLCLTKVRSSRARCPATALIVKYLVMFEIILYDVNLWHCRFGFGMKIKQTDCTFFVRRYCCRNILFS